MSDDELHEFDGTFGSLIEGKTSEESLVDSCSDEEMSSEEEYSDDPIEYVREDSDEDENQTRIEDYMRTPRKNKKRKQRSKKKNTKKKDEEKSNKHVVEHTHIDVEFPKDNFVTEIPSEWLNSWSLVDKHPVVLAVEIPISAFGDDIFSDISKNENNEISISMINHNDPKFKYTKMLLMILSRMMTLGEYKTHHMRKETTKEYLKEPFDGKKISKQDLFRTERNAVRLHPDFCNCPSYIEMLTNLYNNKMIFDYTMEASLGMFEHEVEDKDEDEYDDDYIEDDESDSDPSTEKTRKDSTSRAKHIVMKEHVEKCTIKNVPQVYYFMEELVDSNFQPKGWRMWMILNDPGVNLGVNLNYIMMDNSYLLRPTNSRRPRFSKLINTPMCFQTVDQEKLNNNIFKSRTTLGNSHPVQFANASEILVPMQREEGNAFFPSNVLHGYYAVVFGPTPGVCRAQRDPTNYFDFDAINMRLPTHIDDLNELNTLETLKYASKRLPPFKGSFPFGMLVSSVSPLAMTPNNFWTYSFPFHAKEKMFADPEFARLLRSVAPILNHSSLFSFEGDSEITRAAQSNTTSTMEINWDRMISEATERQEQRCNNPEMAFENPRSQFSRENKKEAYDPLRALSLSEEHKNELYNRDVLMRFNREASKKKLKLEESMRGRSQKEVCEAMTELKKNLLIEFEKKVKTYRLDSLQMPQSFGTGYSWFTNLRSDQQWPEFNVSVHKSDSGNIVSSFMNMIIQIKSHVKRVFWMNDGEVQAAVIRVMLSRNTALHLIFDIKCNLILWGAAGASKSMIIHVVQELSHPGSVKSLTHITENTFVTDDNECYVWIVMEEGEASVLGIDKKNGKENSGDAVLKNITALGLATSSMCQIIDSVRKRIESISMFMASLTVCNNYILPPETNPMQSRYLRDIVTVHQNVAPSADLAAEEKNRNIRNKEDTNNELKTKHRVWHFLCHVVERLIGGVFDDVDMTIYNIRIVLFRKWMKDRCKITARKQNMIEEAARSMVIMHAVYVHFFTETARAKHKCVNNYGKYRKLTFVDFLGIEKHLVFMEEMFTYIATLYHRFYIPVYEYDVIQAIKSFLSGDALLHPSMPTQQGNVSLSEMARMFNKNGNYSRRALPSTNRRRQPSEQQILSTTTTTEGESEGQNDTSRRQLITQGRSLMNQRTSSITSRLLESRRQRRLFRERSNGDLEHYEAAGISYDPDSTPAELPTRNINRLLATRFETEGIDEHNSHRAGVTRQNDGYRQRTWSSSGDIAYNMNYIGLRCRRKQDIVMAISSTIKSGLSNGVISTIVASFMNRSLEVDDLNQPQSKKKIKAKVLCWMNCPTISKSGVNSRKTNYGQTGMYFVNTGALFQHFIKIDILKELEEFMSHQYAQPSTQITAIPINNKRKYLGILATIDVKRNVKHPLIMKHALPSSMTDNALVYNTLGSVTQANKITKRQANPFHVIDADLDVLIVFQHYRKIHCYVHSDQRMWRHDLKSHWLNYISNLWAYREVNNHYYKFAEYIKYYPSDLVKAVQEEELKEKKLEKFLNDKNKSTLSSIDVYDDFTKEWKTMGVGYKDLVKEQAREYKCDDETDEIDTPNYLHHRASSSLEINSPQNESQEEIICEPGDLSNDGFTFNNGSLTLNNSSVFDCGDASLDDRWGVVNEHDLEDLPAPFLNMNVQNYLMKHNERTQHFSSTYDQAYVDASESVSSEEQHDEQEEEEEEMFTDETTNSGAREEEEESSEGRGNVRKRQNKKRKRKRKSRARRSGKEITDCSESRTRSSTRARHRIRQE